MCSGGNSAGYMSLPVLVWYINCSFFLNKSQMRSPALTIVLSSRMNTKADGSISNHIPLIHFHSFSSILSICEVQKNKSLFLPLFSTITSLWGEERNKPKSGAESKKGEKDGSENGRRQQSPGLLPCSEF